MKNKFFVAGILAFALVFGMMVIGCDDGSANGSGEYKGQDLLGNTYTLTFNNADRSVASTDDSYELVVGIKKGGTRITSSGTVSDIADDGTFTLSPAVEGADTFDVVINNGKISSVTGIITAEDGTPYLVSTFDTIYLRAERWSIGDESGDNWSVTNAHGENWTTNPCVKLSDFIDIKVGSSYMITINGTVDKNLDHPYIQFAALGIEEGYLGEISGDSVSPIKAGSFTTTIPLYASDAITGDISDKDVEFFILFIEVLNGSYPNQPTWNADYSRLPENISNDTIMATIKNFSITVQEIPSVAGNLGTYDYGWHEDGTRDYRVARWDLSGQNLTLAKAVGTKLELKFSTAPKGALELIWECASTQQYWNATNILGANGNVISSSTTWNAGTLTLTIDLGKALVNYADYVTKPDLILQLQYLGGVNIFDLGITSASLVQ